MATSASWERYGSSVVLVDSLSRQLKDLRAQGFEFPWTCTICGCSNNRYFGSCEECKSKNSQFGVALAAVHPGADLCVSDHVLLLLARARGPACVEACFAFCEAVASEATDPDRGVFFYRRAFKLWCDLDSDLGSDGVPEALRKEADDMLAARGDLLMHRLSSDMDPILGAQFSTCGTATCQNNLYEELQFADPPLASGTTSEPIAIIIPMRGRERQLEQLLPILRAYLLKQEIHKFQIIVVEQSAGLPYNRGLSLNAGVAYLSHLDTDFKYACFHDVDAAPMECADYSGNDHPTYMIGARLLWEPTCHEEISDDVVRMFELLPDKTLAPPKHLQSLARSQVRDRVKSGVLMCPLQTFFSVNGFSNSFWGWGDEDVDFNQRLATVSKVLHRDGIFASLDYGFHMFTSFGYRWCKLQQQGGSKYEGEGPGNVEWLCVARFLNKDYDRNAEIQKTQQHQRRQEGAGADVEDGFSLLDPNSMQFTEVPTDGSYIHVRFQPPLNLFHDRGIGA